MRFAPDRVALISTFGYFLLLAFPFFGSCLLASFGEVACLGENAARFVVTDFPRQTRFAAAPAHRDTRQSIQVVAQLP